MNGWEEKYFKELQIMRLAGEVIDFYYESITFRLAPRTTYTPDFMVIYPDHIEFVEIKGFRRDDAMVKFKVAAEMFPYFRWIMIEWKKQKGWRGIYVFGGENVIKTKNSMVLLPSSHQKTSFQKKDL